MRLRSYIASAARTKKIAFFILCATTIVSAAYGVDFFSEGEKKFRENKPEEAAPLLATAVEYSGADPRAWLYLGVCYQQLGKLDEAVSVFKRGLSAPNADKKLLYYNLGNTYFMQEKFVFAEEMFTQAAALDENFGPAFLNRANTRIQLNKLQEASDDYSAYLLCEPDSPQRENIIRVQALIAEQFAQEKYEAERAAKAKKAEEERLAALKREEEERRRRILQEVENSLKLNAEATTAVSVGAEGVVGYDEESELE